VPGPSLILGGTPEAAALAKRAVAAGLEVVTSLAGATRAPSPLVGRLRIGGFGGAQGLAAWLRAERVARVVDATHPFAAQMHANAAAACAAAGLPLLRLMRPPWTPVPGDRWTVVDDATEAARLLCPLPQAGEGAIFLAVGRKELPAFAAADARFLVRLIEPAELPLRNAELILARGPFEAADEAALFREKGVRLVVAKNSGGAVAYAKLAVARELGLPAIVIARPALPPAAETASLDEALAFLAG
jgi:precorrin-6A/cobalt-precorrin-6A reductase